MTQYVVLRQAAGIAAEGETRGERWEEVAQYDAASARAAVTVHVRTNDDKGGVFIAIPRRSFQPITVATENLTRLKFT